MKIKILAFLLLLTALPSLAQENQPNNKTFGKALTDRFPTTRTFDVQYEYLAPTKFSSKLFGEPLEKGNFGGHNRVKLSFNSTFFKSKSQKFTLTGSLRYKYESFEFTNLYNNNNNGPYERPSEDFHYFAGGLSATYYTTLFNKTVIYNGTISADGSQDGFQRIKGFVSANILLKRTDNTTITAGLLGNLDSSSNVPIIPIITYNHHFNNSKWVIDAIIPQRILLQRELLENGRISLGTEFINENLYLNLHNANLNGIYELNFIEVKSGITYEYNFAKNIIGTLKAGINNVVNTRITEKGDRTDKYIYDQKQDAVSYFKVGISYNPF